MCLHKHITLRPNGLRQFPCDRGIRKLEQNMPTNPAALRPTRDGGGWDNTQQMEETHWYAMKVYYNRVQPLIADCREAGREFFAPTGIVGSLLFLRCGESDLWHFVEDHRQQVWVYRSADSRQPAVIAEREMEVFRFVVTSGQEGLELLGDDKPEYHEGDRVVVTGGPFKGAEGHIRRIRRDRRLVIAIRGVVAVATTYIHPSLLRKAET